MHLTIKNVTSIKLLDQTGPKRTLKVWILRNFEVNIISIVIQLLLSPVNSNFKMDIKAGNVSCGTFNN